MKVYLVRVSWQYDGSILEGCFSSLEKAQSFAQKLFNQELNWQTTDKGNLYVELDNDLIGNMMDHGAEEVSILTFEVQ